jgi:uncharacterized protein YjbJ (UPF0337 family)
MPSGEADPGLCSCLADRRAATEGEPPVTAKDKAKNAAKEAKGKAKRAAGKATGSPTLEVKGSAEKKKANLKQAKEKVKDSAKK